MLGGATDFGVSRRSPVTARQAVVIRGIVITTGVITTIITVLGDITEQARDWAGWAMDARVIAFKDMYSERRSPPILGR